MKPLIAKAIPTLRWNDDGEVTTCTKLTVHIDFPEGYGEVKSLKARVYDDYFILCAEAQYDGKDLGPVSHVEFKLETELGWLPKDSYYFFLYVDGCPYWEGSFYLSTDLHQEVDFLLNPMSKDSLHYYFLHRLADAETWKGLDFLELSPQFLQDLVVMLYDLYDKSRNGTCDHLPNFLIRGSYTQADHLAFCLADLMLDRGCKPMLFPQEGILQEAATIEAGGYDYVLITLEPVEAGRTRRSDIDDWRTFVKDVLNGRFGKKAFMILGPSQWMMAWEALCPDMRRLANLVDFDLPDWNLTRTADGKRKVAKRNAPAAPAKPREMKLEEMVGLTRVKAEIESTSAMAMFVKRRQDMGLEKDVDNRYHMLFLGNPGTGKTTVAKLIGRKFHEMGLLSRGHTVEVNRARLVGEFIGQTEKKTSAAIVEARGGVLFIDEAYALADNTIRSNDFGKEVIHALLPVLSEPNPDLIVILAGYEDKMKWLLESNQGLKDRFPLSFHFDDYTADELLEMSLRLAKGRGFRFSDDAWMCLKKIVVQETLHRDEHFGNGRWVHNLMEQGVIKAMAQRVMSIDERRPELNLTDREVFDLFTLIEKADIEEAERWWSHQSAGKLVEHHRIGFARG